jgi:mono/diheme cytochrome c family protein
MVRILSCVAGLVVVSAFIDRAVAQDARPADGFQATPEQEAFFEKSVRPILAAKCFECHGEKQQKGGLRLDSRGALLKGNDAGPAVVPGKPEESRFIEVIGYRDPIQMPPKQKLSEAEIAALTEWIRQGAPFPGAAAESGTPAL